VGPGEIGWDAVAAAAATGLVDWRLPQGARRDWTALHQPDGGVVQPEWRCWFDLRKRL